MKKLIAAVVTLAALFTLNTTAFAQEPDKDPPKSTIPVQGQQADSGASGDAEEGAVQLTATQQAVLDLVNKEREAAGQDPLSADATAQKAAQARAKELVDKYSHTRPDGTICFTALYNEGVDKNTWVAENIAMGQKTAEEVMKGWMNSSGHRASILDDKYHYVGLGVYTTGGKTYWVQLFMS